MTKYHYFNFFYLYLGCEVYIFIEGVMFECLISRSVARPRLVKCSISNWCLTSSGHMGVQEATTAPTTKASLKNRFSPLVKCFPIIPCGSRCKEWAKCLFHLHGINSFHTKAAKERFKDVGSRCRQSLISENFTSSFDRERHQRACRTCITIIFRHPINHIDLCRCRCRNGFLNSPKRCHFFNF